MNRLKNGLFVTVLCGVVSLGLAQMADAQLVQNGGFETTTTSPNTDTSRGSGQLGYDINASDWTVGPPSAVTSPYSYDFLFASGAAESTGALG
jgi:hypothetical protein